MGEFGSPPPPKTLETIVHRNPVERARNGRPYYVALDEAHASTYVHLNAPDTQKDHPARPARGKCSNSAFIGHRVGSNHVGGGPFSEFLRGAPLLRNPPESMSVGSEKCNTGAFPIRDKAWLVQNIYPIEDQYLEAVKGEYPDGNLSIGLGNGSGVVEVNGPLSFPSSMFGM